MEFGLVFWFIEVLQNTTTSNYSAIANSQTQQFTTARIRVVQVKYRQGSRNVYNMYLTTTTTPQWQPHRWQYKTGCRYWPPLFRHLSQCCTSFIIPSTKDTGCWMNHCSMPHESPHWNWTTCPSESSSIAQTRDSHTGVIQNTPAKMAQGVPCCMDSMWACIIMEHKNISGQFSSYPGLNIGIVAACVYVSLEQPLYVSSQLAVSSPVVWLTASSSGCFPYSGCPNYPHASATSF
jgi:hypothetical protein